MAQETIKLFLLIAGESVCLFLYIPWHSLPVQFSSYFCAQCSLIPLVSAPLQVELSCIGLSPELKLCKIGGL